MSDNTNTTVFPGDLAYLPAPYRDRVELEQQDLAAIFHCSRETIRTRAMKGQLPPKLPGRPYHRPRWSAAALNALIAAQANPQND